MRKMIDRYKDGVIVVIKKNYIFYLQIKLNQISSVWVDPTN